MVICVLVTGLFGVFFLLNFEEVHTLMRLVSLIKLEYVEQTPMKDLLKGAAAGMVDALGDPYSVYMDAGETGWIYDYVHGVTGGIGVTFSGQKDMEDRIVIRSILKDSPAEHEGLQVNDAIMEVDGKALSGYSAEESIAMVRGVPGTTVELTVLRPEEPERLRFTLIRDEIDIPTSSAGMLPEEDTLDRKIGYLMLARFASNTPGMVEEQLRDLADQGMEALILDLRDNPGGDVASVTKIARHFIPNGVLARPVSRGGEADDFVVEDSEMLKLPFVILINGGSASASEILAGAVQDYQTGVLVGTRSYGKASIQVIYNLPDGGGLKMTIAKYLTPDGRDIGGVGIEPDISLELDAGDAENGGDSQLRQAVRVLLERLEPETEVPRAS
ncbi:MAG: S41 family peptidase [Peptococcaceae bacterium]|nr:S41 family peptidase [Peptococcaceae bacterium]